MDRDLIADQRIARRGRIATSAAGRAASRDISDAIAEKLDCFNDADPYPRWRSVAAGDRGDLHAFSPNGGCRRRIDRKGILARRALKTPSQGVFTL